jgi:hypothetical protein
MREVRGQGQGLTVILNIIWRRFLNAIWRSLPSRRQRGEPPVRFPVRQSCCPVWRPQPRIAGHFEGDRS